MFATARIETVPLQPVRVGTVETPRHTLYERLHALGMPNEAIKMVLTASFRIRDGSEFPLFAIARDARDPTGYTWNFAEIIDIVHVFDQMKEGLHTVTEHGIDTLEHRSRQVAALTPFKNHIDSLVLNREKNERLGTVVKDHTIFEAPSLEELRKQEVMKDLLMNRKRIPLKGKKCFRCKQEEVYQIALQTRSGDEGATLYKECGKCDAKWK